MKNVIIKSILVACLAVGLSGCLTTGAGDSTKWEKFNAIVQNVALVAPEGKENAIDGYRIATIKNIGKWEVRFIGLYRADGYLRARSFQVEGMWTEYSGAPFAWRVQVPD